MRATTTISSPISPSASAPANPSPKDARRAQWLAHLYEPTRASLVAQGLAAPSFEEFWERGSLIVPQQPDDGGTLRRFREDPVAHPLPTPSGRIEIFSAKIAGHGDADCPGHPVWLEKTDVPEARLAVLPRRQPAGRRACTASSTSADIRSRPSIAAARSRA